MQDGGQICSIIGLCNSTVSVRARNKPVSKPAAGVECEVCKLVVTELKTLVTDNTTEAEFEKILDGLCENLPAFKSEVRFARYTVVCKSVVYLKIHCSLSPVYTTRLIRFGS